MLNVILLLLFIVLVELFKQRKLDFKYSIPIGIALIFAYLVDRKMNDRYLSFFAIGGMCAVIYSFSLLTAYKKRVVRLIQEKAILKYDLEKRL